MSDNTKLLYHHLDYRDSLRAYFSKAPGSAARTTNAVLAKALGVHRAFITKVFNQDAHLSSDHLYLLFEYFAFNNDERKYILTSHEYSRTGLAKRKKHLLAELRNLQKSQTHIEKNLDIPFAEVKTENILIDYYLDPNFLLVHSFLTIEKYARDPVSICKHLTIPPQKINYYLEQLLKMGVIARKADEKSYQVINERMHLRDNSSLWTASSNLLRMTGAERLRQMDRDAKMDLSVVLAISDEAHLAIRRELLETFQKCQQFVLDSKSERVYQMTLTLFPWELG
jgi:uncharacterized protein (TIGR02147 family)